MSQEKTSVWKIILVVVVIIFALIFLRVLFRGGINNNNGNNPYVPPAQVETVKMNLAYGPHAQQKFDFYSDGEDSDTLFILVHGGAWIAGDKNLFDEHSRFFVDKGYSVANMNYRLAPDSKYDAQLYDIADLINYVGLNREQFNLQLNYRIVLVGHSAGAHLSALYALKESQYGTRNIDYAITLAGPYDLEIPGNNVWSDPVKDSFLGEVTRAEASPVNHVYSGEQTKFLLISAGQSDGVVDKRHYEVFLEELENKNVFVEGHVIAGRNHGSLVNLIPSNDIVAQEIADFI